MKFILLLALAATLSACGSSRRYEIIMSTTSAFAVKVDTETGDTWYLNNSADPLTWSPIENHK